MSYTKGPWEARLINSNDRGYRRSSPNDFEIVSANSIVPCFVFGSADDGYMHEELKANAKLISAAPDLYEALKEAVCSMEVLDTMSIHADAIKSAKSALKKAEL